MQSFPILVWSLAFLLQSYIARTQVNDSLSKILERIYSDDQQYRNRLGYLQQKHGYNSPEMRIVLDSMRAKDSVNVIMVSRILDEYGWLGPGVVGASGNRALFLVIQHADLDVQLKYLPLVRSAVKTENAKAGSLALLEDLIAVRQGLDQIYGSQIGWNKIDKTHFLFPMIDPDKLDERRLAVGLPPIESYLQNFGMSWDLQQYKENLPGLRVKIKLQRGN